MGSSGRSHVREALTCVLGAEDFGHRQNRARPKAPFCEGGGVQAVSV
jgi:hypothetical protein